MTRKTGSRKQLPLTERARKILVGTGWVAVVALAGTAMISDQDAVAAGIRTRNYVVAESAMADAATSLTRVA